MKKMILLLFAGALLGSKSASAWIYTICNDTDEAVTVDLDYHLCTATAPTIKTLAPRSCVAIDNSYSFYMNCLIDKIKFKKADSGEVIVKVDGQSYLNPKSWGSYTYTLAGNKVKVRWGTVIPEGNKTVAVMKSYSELGFKEWLGAFGATPGSLAVVSLDPTGVSQVVVATATLGVGAWTAGKAIFDKCFRSGKYMVWVNTSDTIDPKNAELEMKSKKGCGASCAPNPKLININQKTVCGYIITSDDLSKTFKYLMQD